MATLVQLSDSTYLNLDTVTVLRCEDGQWRVWFHDSAHALALTDAEAGVLMHHVEKHLSRLSYKAVRRELGRRPWQEADDEH